MGDEYLQKYINTKTPGVHADKESGKLLLETRGYFGNSVMAKIIKHTSPQNFPREDKKHGTHLLAEEDIKSIESFFDSKNITVDI